jgi:hypothetical protein
MQAKMLEALDAKLAAHQGPLDARLDRILQELGGVK